MQEIIKLTTEFNTKYKLEDTGKYFFCKNDDSILKIENKLNLFTLDDNYDFAFNIASNIDSLPKINVDLSKIISFYKNNNNNDASALTNLQEEISNINKLFNEFTTFCELESAQTMKEQNIIYYLYQLMHKSLFYILLNPNFFIVNATAEYLTFFENYLKIYNCAKLYLTKNINNSSLDIECNEKELKKHEEDIEKKINTGIYKSFEDLLKFKNEFRETIEKSQNFLALILFSIDSGDNKIIDLLEKFVMSLNILHSVNENLSIVSYKLFYNEGISKNLNLKREFKLYLNNQKILKEEEKIKNILKNTEDEKEDPKSPKKKPKNSKLEFTLLDYMWIFNPAAKSEIINLFNDQKQYDELLNTINNVAPVDPIFGFGLFPRRLVIPSKDAYFILTVRRNFLIEDTLNEISKPGIKLQNQLKVKFKGEQGVDEGGVKKEFFMLLVRQIFDANYGMFSYNSKVRLFWFNLYTFEPKIKYELIGVILGLAIFNGVILDVKFPMAVYKKLLGIKLDIEDLKEMDLELYNNLKFLLNSNDKNIKEKLETNFTVTVDKFGEKIILPLKEKGEEIFIDYDNKKEYVDLYLDWYFNKSIKEYYDSFEKGFYRVFDKQLSKLLSPEELELIICGTQYLDFYELQKACIYKDGFNKDSETIKYFWEILFEFNEEEKKKFLFFTTGCDRAPIDGLGSLIIVISKGGSNLDELPSTHTCFNNLILPDYKNKELMKKKILTAMNYSEGFGLI